MKKEKKNVICTDAHNRVHERGSFKLVVHTLKCEEKVIVTIQMKADEK